jgi:hypothetical protein
MDRRWIVDLQSIRIDAGAHPTCYSICIGKGGGCWNVKLIIYFDIVPMLRRSRRLGRSLRHCTTSRKVAGLIPVGVIRNEYQGSFLGGKGGRCLRLTTLPPSCADCLETLGVSLMDPISACSRLYRDSFWYLQPPLPWLHSAHSDKFTFSLFTGFSKPGPRN